MTKSIKRLAASALLGLTVSVNAQPLDRRDSPLPLPVNSGDDYYYLIGGGDGIPPPVSYSQSVRITASAGAGFGYSCGRFDPYATIENMINNVERRIKRIPQYFLRGVEAAIAALPGYILNKINPRLYNVVTKHFDEAFEVFEASFKSCQAMERETRQGSNPYHRWVTVALLEKWEIVIGAGEPIDQAEETVNLEGPDEGVVLNSGVRYGGPGQPPITALATVGASGYRLLVSGQDPETDPVLRAWPQIDDWLDWINRVLGSRETFILDGQASNATPGQGLRPEIERVAEILRVELRDAVENYSVASGEPVELSLAIPYAVGGPLIDEIKTLAPNNRELALSSLANDLALAEVLNQEMLAQQLFRAGLSDPDLRQSNAAGVATEVIQQDAFAVLDTEVEKIYRYKMLQQMAMKTSDALLSGYYQRQRQNLPPAARGVNRRPLQGIGIGRGN